MGSAAALIGSRPRDVLIALLGGCRQGQLDWLLVVVALVVGVFL